MIKKVRVKIIITIRTITVAAAANCPRYTPVTTKLPPCGRIWLLQHRICMVKRWPDGKCAVFFPKRVSSSEIKASTEAQICSHSFKHDGLLITHPKCSLTTDKEQREKYRVAVLLWASCVTHTLDSFKLSKDLLLRTHICYSCHGYRASQIHCEWHSWNKTWFNPALCQSGIRLKQS